MLLHHSSLVSGAQAWGSPAKGPGAVHGGARRPPCQYLHWHEPLVQNPASGSESRQGNPHSVNGNIVVWLLLYGVPVSHADLPARSSRQAEVAAWSEATSTGAFI